jgi:hypothetical protein
VVIRRASGLVRLAAVTACWAAAAAQAAEPGGLTDDEVVVKTEGAHRLLLPKDWPVERREDGVIAPASLEEYLSMKFSQVREELQRAQRRIEDVERRVEALEQERKTADQRLRWLEDQLRQLSTAGASP